MPQRTLQRRPHPHRAKLLDGDERHTCVAWLSRHATTRIVGQGISEDMIQVVLNDPRWMPVVGPSTRYDGIVEDGRRLRVVLAEEHPVPLLVTAHWVDED